jgi:hypothetical protein
MNHQKEGASLAMLQEFSRSRAHARVDSMNMIRKGQVKRLAGNDARGLAKLVAPLFCVAA